MSLSSNLFADEIILRKDILDTVKSSDRLEIVFSQQHGFADNTRNSKEPVQEADVSQNKGVQMEIFKERTERFSPTPRIRLHTRPTSGSFIEGTILFR